MNRASYLAALTVLALTAVAAADEYTVEPTAGLYVEPPPLPLLGELNPQSIQVVIAKNLDARTVQVDLPFEFPYFGRLYTRISVADDGWLAFGPIGTVQNANSTLPSTAVPNAVVAALWDRLATRTGEVVTFLKSGATTAPNRVFVVAWNHVNLSDARAVDDLSFEVLLHEGTGVVEIAYSTSGVWNGLSYTAGIENETGTRGFGGPFTTNTNFGRPAADQRFTPIVVPVTGRITRDRPVATEAGLGPAIATDLPVAGADVALVREDRNEIMARARTAADGSFVLTSYGLDVSPTFAVDLLCSGAESRVTDVNGLTWRRRIATGIAPIGAPAVPLVHLDASVDVDDAYFRKALNVQQAAYKGYAWAQAAFDASGKDQIAVRKRIPQLEIRWVQGSAAVTGYTPASSTTAAQALVSDDPKNPDAYDDDVILREYSQHLLATIAPFAGKLTAHVWGPPPPTVPPAPASTPASPIAAFLDGFSFWFAAAVQERPHFFDTKFDDASAPTATVYDLEGPSPTATGPQVAGSVAATLWELVDPADDAFDEFAGTLPATGWAVFTTLDERTATTTAATVPSGSPAPTIGSFFERWRPTRTEAEAVATSRTFIAHKAIPDDKYEPNDRATETQQFALETPKTIDLVLNQSNTDRFTFTLGATPLSLAVSYAEATQADVTIRDAADQPVTLALTPSTTSPIVVTTSATQAQGTYVVQIAWKSGPAAHYSLATFTPPSLATPLPSKWTVGLPFNQTLTLAGGLLPATFSLASGAIPGLSVQSGARYVGTPTTIGTYPLTFTVTDASGAGPQTLAPFTIQIFEALTLPAVFGVAADKPVSVDVGRGGAAAVWTKGADDPVQPPPPGFVVTDGPTLHVDGPAIGPRSFKVSASAIDPAPLNVSRSARTSRVVVCAKLSDAARSRPVANAPFGYWFDAIAGSRATLAVRFSNADAPGFQTLVDDRGTEVELGDRNIVQGAAGVRIVDFVVPRTARYFLVFSAAPAFTGKVVAVRLAVRPPLRASGIANIATPSTQVSTRFTAVAGSKATVVLRSGPVPKPAKPGILKITAPDGTTVELPSVRIGAGGARETFVGVDLPFNGEYVMTVGGDGASTGPLFYDVVIRAPRNAVFSLD